MGQRHNLEQVQVIDQFAKMTEAAGADFAGLDRYKARELVLEKLEELGLLEKVIDYENAISKCERCKTVLEPLISTQWFCRMDKLRDLALAKLRDDRKPKFVPDVPYEKVYSDWLENLRDWTISRQLWWGHQIPAWYTKDGELIVARSREEAEKKAGTNELTQDEDVLDTWFSSALWPFSTLGWPAETEDLKTFYPTSVLITARDIMTKEAFENAIAVVMAFGGSTNAVLHLLAIAHEAEVELTLDDFTKVPIADVYVTGTVLDKHGQRMSKTKMNGVDPLEVFDKYGVDATRLMLASIGSTDTRWNEKQVESYRNFANKIWNAARFCLMNAEGAESIADPFGGDRNDLPLHDRWILTRLNKTARDVNAQLKEYDFHAAVQTLYHFFWDDFCDWYIELSKATVTAENDSPERSTARARMISILEQSLRLLHPFMPYLTEELWQKLPVNHSALLHQAYAGVEPTVMLAAFPQADAALIDERAESEMQAVIDLISRVRNIRAEMNIKPSVDLPVLVLKGKEERMRVFEKSDEQIQRLTRSLKVLAIPNQQVIEMLTPQQGQSEVVSELADFSEHTDSSFAADIFFPKASARAVLAAGTELTIPLKGLIDFAQERARLSKEKEKLQKEAAKLAAQLGNADFVNRAPTDKVAELQARVADIDQRTAALDQMLEALS